MFRGIGRTAIVIDVESLLILWTGQGNVAEIKRNGDLSLGQISIAMGMLHSDVARMPWISEAGVSMPMQR